VPKSIEIAMEKLRMKFSALNIDFNGLNLDFYARKQLLLSVHLSHHNSVRPSVCHTGGSVKNGAS